MSENNTNSLGISSRNSRYAIYLKIKNILEQRMFQGVALDPAPTLPKRQDFGLKNIPFLANIGRSIRGKLFPRTAEEHRQRIFNNKSIFKPITDNSGKIGGRLLRFAARQALSGNIPGLMPTARGNIPSVPNPTLGGMVSYGKTFLDAMRGVKKPTPAAPQSNVPSSPTTSTITPTKPVPSSSPKNILTPEQRQKAIQNRISVLQRRIANYSGMNISGLPRSRADQIAALLHTARSDIPKLRASLGTKSAEPLGILDTDEEIYPKPGRIPSAPTRTLPVKPKGLK